MTIVESLTACANACKDTRLGRCDEITIDVGGIEGPFP